MEFLRISIFASLMLLPVFSFAAEAFSAAGIARHQVLKAAPEFELKDLDGRSVKLADFRGKVVLVHFWATWCGPCQTEMHELKGLWADFRGKDLIVLAVAGDSQKAVKSFVADHGLDMPVLVDQYGGALRSYRVGALPSSYIVDKKGQLAGTAIGPRKWDSEAVRGLLKSMMSE